METWFVGSGPSLLGAIGVLATTYLGMAAARAWISSALKQARVDPATRLLAQRVITAGIGVFGLLTAFTVLGVSPATILALLGAVGLAFSLALQDILKNFFSGMYLLIERPFGPGDVIRVKDYLGVVEHIGVRTTTLRTAENIQVLVPNAVVFAEVVSNHTLQTGGPSLPVAGPPAADAAQTPAQPSAVSSSAAIVNDPPAPAT
ncbi:MAG: mechanosensitive ion channel [Chloroflexi bacterium]|nr:mechanosensitive ion channel [Chloroflexota bacterium]